MENTNNSTSMCLECKKIFTDLQNGDCMSAIEDVRGNNCCGCVDEMGNTFLINLVRIPMTENSDCAMLLSCILNKPNIETFINTKGQMGNTAMLVAVMNGNDVAATMLDNAGASKNIKNDYDQSVELDDGEEVYPEVGTVGETTLKFDEVNDNGTIYGFLTATNEVLDNISDSVLKAPLGFLNEAEMETEAFFESLNNSSKPTSNNSYNPTSNNSYNPTSNNILLSQETSDAIPSNSNLDTDKLMSAVKSAQQSNLLSNSASNTSKLLSNTSKLSSSASNPSKFLSSASNSSKLSSSASNPSNLLSNISKSSSKLLNSFNPNSSSNYASALSNSSKPSIASSIMSNPGSTSNYASALSNPSSLLSNSSSKSLSASNIMSNHSNPLNSSSILKSLHDSNNTTQLENELSGGGYNFSRRLKLHSDKFNYSGGKQYDSDSDDESVSNNPLSRIIKSRKNDLHTEMEDRLLKLLDNGKIMYKSKPVEASATNAKLLKSFLYNYVRNKNPELTGFEKITLIKDMPDSEIIELTTDVNLDEVSKKLENFRAKNLEMKNSKHENSVKNVGETSLSESDIVTDVPKKKEKKEKKEDKDKKKKKK